MAVHQIIQRRHRNSLTKQVTAKNGIQQSTYTYTFQNVKKIYYQKSYRPHWKAYWWVNNVTNFMLFQSHLQCKCDIILSSGAELKCRSSCINSPAAYGFTNTKWSKTKQSQSTEQVLLFIAETSFGGCRKNSVTRELSSLLTSKMCFTNNQLASLWLWSAP